MMYSSYEQDRSPEGRTLQAEISITTDNKRPSFPQRNLRDRNRTTPKAQTTRDPNTTEITTSNKPRRRATDKERTESVEGQNKTNEERSHSKLQTATRKEGQQHRAKRSRPRASTPTSRNGGTETSKGRTQTTT